MTGAMYRIKHLIEGWLTGSEGQSIIIMAVWQHAGRHGARAIAESLSTNWRQGESQTGSDVGF